MDRRNLWLVFAVAAGVAVTGIPYWRLPGNVDYLGNLPFLLGFVGLAALTTALAASGTARLRHIFWAMLGAFPLAVAIRVGVEVAQDPTAHNLWPFELVLAALLSLVAVLPGLAIGALARRIRA